LRFGVVAPERILAEPADASSPPSFPLRTVDLYSAPARPVPGGCAVVRADLAEWDSGRPAAWAMVQIESELVRATGLADGAGHLALMFPYPEAVEALASPLNGPGLLLEQSWTLRFRVWHTFDARPGAAADLDSLLSRATGPESDGLWSGGSPPFPFEVAELLFGRELVVPAGGPGDSRQLWITPAGSPP
jgi:hypothetical protein